MPVPACRFFALVIVLCILVTGRALAGDLFVTPPHYAVGYTPTTVVTADFNGDGKPDLAVVSYQEQIVSVLLNNGDGTYATAVNYSTGEDANPISITVGDFNGDGKVDLAVGAQESALGQVLVFRGNGDGTFQAAITSNTGAMYPVALAATDVNGDGKLDVIVNNGQQSGAQNDASVGVMFGNGDGTLQPAITTITINHPSPSAGSLVIGDFNHDSKIDVAVLNSGIVTVLLGEGSGKFQTPVNYYPPGANFESLQTADLNSDGNLDLVMGDGYGDIDVMLGNGDGTFQNQITNTGSVIAYAIAISDINGDGKLDVVTGGDGAVSVFLGHGDGTFSTPVIYVGGYASADRALVIADLNGDGKPDVAVSNGYDDSVNTIFGNGDGTLQSIVLTLNPGGPLAVGDFNGDGKLDVVAASILYNAVEVYLGDGKGGLKAPTAFATGHEPLSITVADFNGDGKLDIATANYSTVSVLFGNGNGTFHKAVQYSTNSNLGYPNTYITSADFNGDGKPDLAVITRPVGESALVAIMLNRGDGTFLPAVLYPGFGHADEVTFADFNKDGILDMAVTTGVSPDPVNIFLGNGDGTFQNPTNVFTGNVDPFIGIVAADLTNNGNQDLVLSYGLLETLLGNGNGTFQKPMFTGAGQGQSLSVADFNGDGKADVAQFGLDSFLIFFGIGDGTFNQVDYGVVAHSAAVGDFNGDKVPDVAISNGLGVYILLNQGGTSKTGAVDYSLVK